MKQSKPTIQQMNKMEQRIQRAATVSKFLVLSLLIIGCVSKKELIQTNDDTTILNLYLKDIVATQKKGLNIYIT